MKDGQLLSYQMQPADVSAWAARTAQTQSDLLGFADYSAGFFDRTTADQLASMFQDTALAPEEQEQMTHFAVALNAEYFSGRRTITAEDPAWAMWEEYLPDSFFTYYMRSILQEPPQDMTRCAFPAAEE